MSDWSFPFVVRDPGEIINAKTLRQLPGFLDGDDADITREILGLFREAALPHDCTVGQANQVLEDYTPHERKMMLTIARRRAGLPDPDEIESAAHRIRLARREGQISEDIRPDGQARLHRKRRDRRPRRARRRGRPPAHIGTEPIRATGFPAR